MGIPLPARPIRMRRWNWSASPWARLMAKGIAVLAIMVQLPALREAAGPAPVECQRTGPECGIDHVRSRPRERPINGHRPMKRYARGKSWSIHLALLLYMSGFLIARLHVAPHARKATLHSVSAARALFVDLSPERTDETAYDSSAANEAIAQGRTDSVASPRAADTGAITSPKIGYLKPMHRRANCAGAFARNAGRSHLIVRSTSVQDGRCCKAWHPHFHLLWSQSDFHRSKYGPSLLARNGYISVTSTLTRYLSVKSVWRLV